MMIKDLPPGFGGGWRGGGGSWAPPRPVEPLPQPIYVGGGELIGGGGGGGGGIPGWDPGPILPEPPPRDPMPPSVPYGRWSPSPNGPLPLDALLATLASFRPHEFNPPGMTPSPVGGWAIEYGPDVDPDWRPPTPRPPAAPGGGWAPRPPVGGVRRGAPPGYATPLPPPATRVRRRRG